jgi:hypothetical protein
VNARRAIAVLEYVHTTQDPFWYLSAQFRRALRARWVEWRVQAGHLERLLDDERTAGSTWTQ